MNNTRYFKLGLFILLAIGGLIAGAIGLGAAKLFDKSITFHTSFDQSVSGLVVGAPVRHRGVTIGHVKSIRFPPDAGGDSGPSAEPFKYVLVEMAIDSKTVAELDAKELKRTIDQMVAAGLRARIGQSGITGSAQIELNYFDPARYPITKVPVRTGSLYIPSAPGASLNQVVDAVTDIATKLQRANIDKVIGHVDSLILRIDQSVQDLHVAELQSKTSGILDDVQVSSRRLKQLVDDPKLAKAFSDLPEITSHVRSASAQVDNLLKNGKFDESAIHLQRTLAEAERLLATSSDSVRTILGDLEATISNARELTDNVKANPAQLLFGRPPAHTTYGSSK
jgi:ABC-type transporter Mla subunit MlaD